MSKSLLLLPGAQLGAVYAGPNVAVTAGGTGDATEVSTPWISAAAMLGGFFGLAFTTTLGDGETLTFAANLQDATSIAGAGAADFGDAVAATQVAISSGGSTEVGVALFNVEAVRTRGFFRLQWTPNLSRANTDTAAIVPFFVSGHDRHNPPVLTGLTRLNGLT